MLKETQEWFASIIGVPIDMESRIKKITPTGGKIEEEAACYISKSKTLLPYQRIEIYNQQYWWRLLSALHENFPLVTRLFGHSDFNEKIGIPFLTKYPPDHWSLSMLGSRLADWIEEAYFEEDKNLILHASKIDIAYTEAFFEPQLPPIYGDASLLKHKHYLQPHARLFSLPYDLFAFRKEFLKKDPDYWMENDFPKIEKGKTYYFLLFRQRNNVVVWKELTFTKHLILQKFEVGASIEEVCEFIESNSPSFQEEVAEELASWFKEWSSEALLTRERKG